MKKDKKAKSLRYNILFLAAVSIIAPMFFFIYISYTTYEKNIENNASRYSLQLTKQIGTNLDFKLEQYKDMLMQIITNRGILHSLEEAQKSTQNIVEDRKLSSQITEYISVAPEFKSIAFITEDRYIMVFHRWEDQEMQSEAYKKTMLDKNQFQWFGGREQNYRNSISSYSSNVFSISKEIYDIDTGITMDTVIVIDIQNRILEGVCNKVTNAEMPMNWCIADQDGNVLFKNETFFAVDNISDLIDSESEEESYYVSREYNGEKVVAAVSNLETNDWKIVTTLDNKYIRKEAVGSVRPILILFILLLVIIIAGVFVLVKIIAVPINNLAIAMKYPVQGDFAHKSEYRENRIEEIRDLNSSYNFMLDEINKLVQKVYEEEEKKRVVQIKALESQINPHFLYNTLDTIKWTALLQKADNAAEMASMLSKLLHISLGKGQDMIRVEDEIEHVKAYIGIQKYRLDIQFDTIFQIEDDVKECYVPKILLQPIVENSILHGFSGETKGFIQISCKKEGENIVFTVSDNGQGFDDTVIKKEEVKSKRFSGIGVDNVDERIKLICGKEFGVTTTSKVGYGTNVRIILPFQK